MAEVLEQENGRLRAQVLDLEQQLEARKREIRYYRRLAKAAGDHRLREAEDYSRLVARLKEKIWLAETQHTALLELHREIERIGITDDLTQVLNRRGMTERFNQRLPDCQHELTQTGTQRRCFCALLDIEGLARVNAEYGYRAGDELLRGVGKLLSRSNRLSKGDLIGRFAGKVFIVAMPSREEAVALAALESLLDQIGRFRFRIVLDTKIQVSVKAGVATVGPQDGSVLDVIERADTALRATRAPGADRLVYRPAGGPGADAYSGPIV